MLNKSLLARSCRALQTAARMSLCILLSALCITIFPLPASSTELQSLTTGIVPTMGINEVTEGTLLFKTNQSGRYRHRRDHVGLTSVELPKANRMSRMRITPPVLAVLVACLLATSLWQVGEGSWIYTKARFAQYLLQRAWSRTLAGETAVKPWPWTDTWPIVRLTVPSKKIDLIVLNGAYGRTLAFGPGYVESSALPGSVGTTILTGHRDTHFSFLKGLHQQDELVIETATGKRLRYVISESRIVDSRSGTIALSPSQTTLALVTCYPFDSIMPGGPLRYIVVVEQNEAA